MKTYRQKFLEHWGLPKDSSLSIEELASITGSPVEALQEVYNRGVGAWKTNPESVRLKGSFKKDPSAPRSAKLGKEQWGMARLYSFLMGGKTQTTADADIVKEYKL